MAGCEARVDTPEFSKDLVPISGVITYQKKPLAGAAVTFFPTGQNAVRAAYALTDDSGQYQLMTPISGVSAKNSLGAVPGSYRVMISHLAMPDGSPVPTELTTADAIEKGATESLPARYSNEQQSILKAEVQANTPRSDLNFNL